MAGPLSRSRWADPIGAEDVRQQAVSGAMAHIDGGSVLRGEWQPPEQSKIMFGGYATHWVADRRLEPRSRELYAMLLRLHIMPWFGDLALDRIARPDGPIVAHRSSASGSFGINRGEVLPPTASDLEHGGEG